MILLELTEKEFELIKKSIEIEREVANFHYETNNLEEDRRGLELCDQVLSKLNKAEAPRGEVLVTFNQLFLLKSMAKDEYKRLHGNTIISGKKLEERDFVHISLANAIFMWLNGKSLLKNVVKFDYTDDSTEYEGSE